MKRSMIIASSKTNNELSSNKGTDISYLAMPGVA